MHRVHSSNCALYLRVLLQSPEVNSPVHILQITDEDKRNRVVAGSVPPLTQGMWDDPGCIHPTITAAYIGRE